MEMNDKKHFPNLNCSYFFLSVTRIWCYCPWLVHDWLNRPGLKVRSSKAHLMFCWPCTIVYHCNETNVMHFSSNLLRIRGLFMFRVLLAHPREVLNKRHLVYCVRTISVGCGTIAVSQNFSNFSNSRETATMPQPAHIIRRQYTKCRFYSASWGWANNARNM
jgi:Zn-finger protein